MRPEGRPPPARVPPPWYREIWPWLLALGIVVLALIGGVVGYQAYQDDSTSSDEPEAVTVTQTTGTETTATTAPTTTEPPPPPPEPVTMPDVIGESYVAAGTRLEGLGLAADSYAVASQETRGTVVAQRPNAGTTAKEGDIVRNNVALGTGTRETKEIPDVTGPTASNARDTVRRAGFTVRTTFSHAPSSEEVGEVLTQQPAAGSSAPELTQVTIYVGR